MPVHTYTNWNSRPSDQEEPDFVRDCEAGEVTKSASEPNRQVESEFLEEQIEPFRKYFLFAKEQILGHFILKS